MLTLKFQQFTHDTHLLLCHRWRKLLSRRVPPPWRPAPWLALRRRRATWRRPSHSRRRRNRNDQRHWAQPWAPYWLLLSNRWATGGCQFLIFFPQQSELRVQEVPGVLGWLVVGEVAVWSFGSFRCRGSGGFQCVLVWVPVWFLGLVPDGSGNFRAGSSVWWFRRFRRFPVWVHLFVFRMGLPRQDWNLIYRW